MNEEQRNFMLIVAGAAMIPLAVLFLSPQNPIYTYMMVIGSISLAGLTVTIVKATRRK